MKRLLCFAGFVSAAVLSIGAAPFENLDFEAAQTKDVVRVGGREFGTTGDLLPGWSFYQGDSALRMISFNSFPPVFTSCAALITQRQFPSFVEGSYALYVLDNINDPAFSLIQEGDVPLDATRLQLRSQGYPFAVKINGMPLTAINRSGVDDSSPFPEEWGFDISGFAGQRVRLEIGTSGIMSGRTGGAHLLDSVEFVPEPKTSDLLLLGCLAALAIPKRRHLQIGRSRALQERRFSGGLHQHAVEAPLP